MRTSVIAKLVVVLLVALAIAVVCVRVREFDHTQACAQDATNTTYICK